MHRPQTGLLHKNKSYFSVFITCTFMSRGDREVDQRANSTFIKGKRLRPFWPAWLFSKCRKEAGFFQEVKSALQGTP